MLALLMHFGKYDSAGGFIEEQLCHRHRDCRDLSLEQAMFICYTITIASRWLAKLRSWSCWSPLGGASTSR